MIKQQKRFQYHVHVHNTTHTNVKTKTIDEIWGLEGRNDNVVNRAQLKGHEAKSEPHRGFITPLWD